MLKDPSTLCGPIPEHPIYSGENSFRLQQIMYYMIGGTHVYIKEHPKKCFSFPDLFGGINSDWSQTPLHFLFDHFYYYEYRKKADSDEKSELCKTEAGKLAGIIFMHALHNDLSRTYDTQKEGQNARKYKAI